MYNDIVQKLTSRTSDLEWNLRATIISKLTAKVFSPIIILNANDQKNVENVQRDLRKLIKAR